MEGRASETFTLLLLSLVILSSFPHKLPMITHARTLSPCPDIPGCVTCSTSGRPPNKVTLCDQCQPGYYLTQGICYRCGVGDWCDGTDIHHCPRGTTTCCPRRSSPDSCNLCKAGYGGSNCTQCKAGSWSDGGPVSDNTTLCFKCPASRPFSEPGAADPRQCRKTGDRFCDPGSAGPKCEQCRPGTWSAGGLSNSSTCELCPAGTHSRNNGASSVDQCVDIDACVAFPCTLNATCQDLPAPAPNSTLGRNCTCQAGEGYNETTGCSAAIRPNPTASGLSVNTPVLAAGSNELLRFTAFFTRDSPQVVNLHESTANGTLGPFIMQMEPSPTNCNSSCGNSTGNNNSSTAAIFSASFSKIFPQNGTFFYVASVGGTSNGSSTPPVALRVLPAPTNATMQARASQMLALQQQLNNLSASGNLSIAIQQMSALISSLPEVRPGSVQTLPNAVFWDSVEGIPFVIFVAANGTIGGGVPQQHQYMRGLSGRHLSSLRHTQNVLQRGLRSLGLESLASNGSQSEGCSPKGRALVLMPDASEEGLGMTMSKVLEMVDILKGADYLTTFKCGVLGDTGKCAAAGTRSSGPVGMEDFKNWQEYAIVLLYAHGFYVTNIRPHTDTPPVNLDLSHAEHSVNTHLRFQDLMGQYKADIIARRIVLYDGHTGGGVSAALTAPFFSQYTGEMDGTFVHFLACSAAGEETSLPAYLSDRGALATTLPKNDFARVFVSEKGAASFSGYDFSVGINFGTSVTKSAIKYLVDGGMADFQGCAECQREEDHPWDALYPLHPRPTVFKAYYSSASKKLPVQCHQLSDFDVFIEYFWPPSQKDLDTGTKFLGQQVGFACGSSTPYMNFSGDDTRLGGSERITVDVSKAKLEGKWNQSVPIFLNAGWYTPARGSGQATVRVALKNKRTGQTSNDVERSIVPGQQGGCSSTLVGTVTVSMQAQNIVFSLV